MSDIEARIEGAVGRLTLNRPSAIHALTKPMCEAMAQALLAWRDDPAVKLVLIDHAEGTRGFCAGGDIRMIAESGAGDGAAARVFFHDEYRLNHLIHAYPKPYVAAMDGIAMGGGVGVSVHGRVRIATERTSFAMPETGIGLFPDVGGGWFLPRLPGRLGVFMALTGARLDGAECRAVGLATHYIESADLPDLKAMLVAGEDLDLALTRFDRPAPTARIEANRTSIDRLFAADVAEDIVAALEADGSEWAGKELATLRKKSPQAVKVALRQFALGARAASFADVMRMEYRLASRVVLRHDFQEGVRAVIVDKDNAPRWDPARLEDVGEALLDALFAPFPEGEEWTPYDA